MRKYLFILLLILAAVVLVSCAPQLVPQPETPMQVEEAQVEQVQPADANDLNEGVEGEEPRALAGQAVRGGECQREEDCDEAGRDFTCRWRVPNKYRGGRTIPVEDRLFATREPKLCREELSAGMPCWNNTPFVRAGQPCPPGNENIFCQQLQPNPQCQSGYCQYDPSWTGRSRTRCSPAVELRGEDAPFRGVGCFDGVDGDWDRLIDCEDSDCEAVQSSQHIQGSDYYPYCTGARGDSRIPESDLPDVRMCLDGIDNDGDGKVDCRDRDCISGGEADSPCYRTSPYAGEASVPSQCGDRRDNDRDNLIDCNDPNCRGVAWQGSGDAMEQEMIYNCPR